MQKTKFLFIVLVCALILGLGGVSIAKSDNAQTGNANQNQNQEQNQGEDVQNQEQNQEQESEEEQVNTKNQDQEKMQINAELHRSTVSNFVQELLDVAEKEGNIIGEQVRTIAQEQNQNKEKVVMTMEKVQNRSKIKTFLFGSDYKNLGQLRSEMVQTRNRLEQLNGLMEQLRDEDGKVELQNQIQEMEQERLRIEEFIRSQEGKFSLFGWLTRLFNKKTE